MLIRLLTLITILAYPFVIFWGLKYFSPRSLAVFVGVLIVLRLILSSKQVAMINSAPALLLAGVVVCGYSLLTNSELGLLLYPVFINIVFASMFLLSILYPPTIIERFARLENSDLPPAAVKYCRKVTIVWVCFFTLNSIVSALTVFYGSQELWRWYNGLIAYCIVIALFLGEFAYRKLLVIPRIRAQTPS